jgi:hypothetical protein
MKRAMFARLIAEEPALWTIAAAGRVEGCVVREQGRWRLSWFDGADRRLATYRGPVDGDLDALAAALAARLGRPVELNAH